MHGENASFELTTVLAVAAVIALGSIANQAAQAQTYTVLHTFTGFPSDGQNPSGGVILDVANNLYGTIVEGGPHCGSPGCGTVFKLTQQSNGVWTETVLHSFNGDDGRHPRNESLLMDKSGNLFGTTAAGGRWVTLLQGRRYELRNRV